MLTEFPFDGFGFLWPYGPLGFSPGDGGTAGVVKTSGTFVCCWVASYKSFDNGKIYRS